MIKSTTYLEKYRTLVVHTGFVDGQGLARSLELENVSLEEAARFRESMGWKEKPHNILK